MEHGLRHRLGVNWLDRFLDHVLGCLLIPQRLAVKSRVFLLLFFWSLEFGISLHLFCLAFTGVLWRLLLFARNPLHKQVDIVLFQVDVVQWLLGVKCTHDVLKSYQSVLLFSEDSYVFKFTKHPENLHQIRTSVNLVCRSRSDSRCTYHFNVFLA